MLFTGVNCCSAAVILVDPGHGGEDIGAKGVQYIRDIGPEGITVKNLVYEKDLALSFAKKIYEKLRKHNHTVYLTRDVDKTVSLEERAQLAEKMNADVYISVHMNSDTKSSSHGIETYYLDNHNDLAVKKVEKVENQKISNREDFIINKILIDLTIQRTVVQSKQLAHAIHSQVKDELAEKYQLNDRKVRPGLLYVLALSKRPAVLLEVGFMSNEREMGLLNSELFQEDYAQAVESAVNAYLTSMKKN
ncbi:MAG: N-acetylmuramoyl-L-alanine amidase [Oligoflexia bacterium]|nr:N-acetylmuramoyl-L-alanine amidase [Oligoflexia bacterium]MBF0366091.1 N-acetylmuramoyl-L-alanine amidase [Oligoflexia bacterium]